MILSLTNMPQIPDPGPSSTSNFSLQLFHGNSKNITVNIYRSAACHPQAEVRNCSKDWLNMHLAVTEFNLGTFMRRGELHMIESMSTVEWHWTCMTDGHRTNQVILPNIVMFQFWKSTKMYLRWPPSILSLLEIALVDLIPAFFWKRDKYLDNFLSTPNVCTFLVVFFTKFTILQVGLTRLCWNVSNLNYACRIYNNWRGDEEFSSGVGGAVKT